MRAATSLVLAVLAASASAQAFGRFGYSVGDRFHSLRFTKSGVAADHPAADELRFPSAVEEIRPLETSEFGQTLRLGKDEPGLPSKLRLSLLVPGVSIYYPKGLRLKLGSTAAPYLTWQGGSGSAGIPTPTVKWVALSFRDAQPALVLGFPGQPGSLTLSGRPGDWEIRADDYVGWVRVGLPRGLLAEPTNTAAALGRLARAASTAAPLLTLAPPSFLGFRAQADEDGNGVVGIWRFSQPGFVLPAALSIARLGGYPVTAQSATLRIDQDLGLGQGPHDSSESAELRVRFPVRRVPLGRAIGLGDAGSPIGTISPQDIPSVSELALENLLGPRDVISRRSAEAAYAEFLSQATFAKEPFTQQDLTFNAAGEGIDLSAAHALLSQALSTGTRPSSQTNALLTSIGWRRDWNSWLPWVSDGDRRRRAAALAALAGALCPEPNRRVAAGMLQAGLAAERGLIVWRRRRGLLSTQTPPTLLEPFAELRRGIFRLQSPNVKPDPFVDGLLSPLRVFTEEAVRMEDREGTLLLTWPVLEPKAGILALSSTSSLDLQPFTNLPRFVVERVSGLTEARYTPETAGTCEVKLSQPVWATRPVRLAPAPRYSEPRL